MTAPIVAAYSGAAHGAAAIPRLVQQYGGEVVAVILDLGQGDDLEEVHARALAAGAARAHVLDVREAFVREFVLPALHAGARADGDDALAIALGRPLVARSLVEIARIEGAAAVAHGCTGADRARLDLAIGALGPDLRVLPPLPEGAAASLPRVRSTLWGRVVEYDADTPPESSFAWTQAPARAPGTPAHVEIRFEAGVPVTINAVPLPLTELVESLSIIAGQHGIGRVAPGGGDRSAGVRRMYEVPAAVVLQAAHEALETGAAGPELARLKRQVNAEYARLVCAGQWFSLMRESLDAFNAVLQKQVTGSVQIRLLKGEHTILGCRRSNPAAYAPAAASAAMPPS